MTYQTIHYMDLDRPPGAVPMRLTSLNLTSIKHYVSTGVGPKTHPIKKRD